MCPYTRPTYNGYCTSCKTSHSISENSVVKTKAFELMASFEKIGSIDIFSKKPAEKYSTNPLFQEPRGKMFGILHGSDNDGNETFLYAFSGQYLGQWLAHGWVPPLFDLDRFTMINNRAEKKIKKLTHHLATIDPTKREKITQVLKTKRKQMSQKLMLELHSIYQLHNLKNECKTLHQAFNEQRGIPTGTGDCCAPKLLNAAALQSITPIALTEFYWGKENKSRTKNHRSFYPSCKEKCSPILGFLLCGINSNI